MPGQSTAWPAFICSFLLALFYYLIVRLKVIESIPVHGLLLAFSFVGFNFLISWLYDRKLHEIEKRYARETKLIRSVKGWVIVIISLASAIGFLFLSMR
jgi:hypothetical protein